MLDASPHLLWLIMEVREIVLDIFSFSFESHLTTLVILVPPLTGWDALLLKRQHEAGSE